MVGLLLAATEYTIMQDVNYFNRVVFWEIEKALDQVLRAIRRRARERPFGDEFEESDVVDYREPAPYDGVHRVDVARAVRSALRKVNPRDREVLIQRFFEGQPLMTISKRMGLSRERVRQLEMRGLKFLRAQLVRRQIYS
jgi:RNA polymerase nonessential primary-like sigma factor